MANQEATVKLNADISQLKSEMQKASRVIKQANAEFKTAAAGMDKWSDNADGLQAKLKQLNTVLGAQKKQLSLLEQELEDTIKLNGANSAAADNMRLRIEGQKAAIAKTEKEIRKYDTELKVVNGELDNTADAEEKTEKATDKMSDGFTTAKGVLADLVASGIKMAISALKDLAKYAMEAYKEFDEGADAVIKATGATGDAAKELEESYNRVAHNVIGDMGDIGSALGEVNTRFGFTGDELESATEQFMKFADITGVDATSAVKLVSRAIENSGMEAKDYTRLLDVLAKAGQSTGVSVDSLAESVTKNGATLRQLGYTTEESIAMLAKFEKEGVNADTVLAGMKKAVANWGKEGKNAKEEYAKALDEIARTEDVAAASEKAIEIFGTKAGPELVEDIQAGKLEYKDFLKVLQQSEGTVTDTYEATQDGFDKITLAIQGAKSDIGKFMSDIATEYQDDIVAFINKVKDGIKKVIQWVIKNGDLIIETLKSIGKVIAVVFAVKTFSKWAGAINGAIKAVKGFAAAMKGVEAASSLASSATGIFANLVSPGGAIVLGIAAVTAVTVALVNAFKEEKKQIDVLNEAEKESIEKSHALKAAYDEMDTTRKNNMKTVDAEFGYYRELLKEFDSIVGGNGEVKKGYEDRATFIMTTLNEALGMEMQMQDGIIQNYATERQKINELIETKKAELILKANEEAYAEAIQKKTEAATVYANAQNTFNDVLKRAEEQAVKVNEANLEYARILREDGIEAAEDYMYTQQEVFDTYAQLQQEVTNTRAALHDATDAYQGYNQTIQNYEGLSAAIISGDSQKITDAMIKTENSFKTANNTTADALKRQRDQFDANYKTLKAAIESGDKTITQQMVNDAKQLADEAQKEYLKSGQQTVAGYAKGLKDNQTYAEQAAKNLGYGSLEEFNEAMGIESPSKQTYASGEYFAQGFINGMGNKESAIYQKAKALAQKAIQGLKDGQKEGSPSKITTQSGKFFTQGFINGIGSMSKDLIDVVKDLVKDALNGLNSVDLMTGVKQTAAQVMGSGNALSFGNVSGIRAALSQQIPAAGYARTSNVTNNYNLVQNNTSPKALSALETFQARRRQIAIMKAMS
jgi:TP901 family phage tail tape measure protein